MKKYKQIIHKEILTKPHGSGRMPQQSKYRGDRAAERKSAQSIDLPTHYIEIFHREAAFQQLAAAMLPLAKCLFAIGRHSSNIMTMIMCGRATARANNRGIREMIANNHQHRMLNRIHQASWPREVMAVVAICAPRWPINEKQATSIARSLSGLPRFISSRGMADASGMCVEIDFEEMPIHQDYYAANIGRSQA